MAVAAAPAEVRSQEDGRRGVASWESGVTSVSLSGARIPDLGELAAGLAPLSMLLCLDLSGCQLVRLPQLSGPAARSLSRLDASRNALEVTDGVRHCCALRQLLLAHNRLRHVGHLDKLPKLEELDVSHNLLGPTPGASLHMVGACDRLRSVWISGNPLAELANHRAQLVDLIPSLVLVDGTAAHALEPISMARPSSAAVLPGPRRATRYFTATAASTSAAAKRAAERDAAENALAAHLAAMRSGVGQRRQKPSRSQAKALPRISSAPSLRNGVDALRKVSLSTSSSDARISCRRP
mmetsp:Transcript_47846/g.137798  ORF Transcript_47846/g.137798 Transcript_47846/m.137798 type:complete len:296 (+) Transcript_47846:73-960(+)